MPGSKSRAGFWTHWLPVAVWMVLIMVGTSLPRPPRLGVESGDKLAHLVAYGVLGFLLMRAFRDAVTCTWWRAAAFSLIIGTLYGVLDEVHQAFLLTRSCSPEDLLADVIGLTAAVLVTWGVGCRLGRNRTRERPKAQIGDDAHV